MGHLVVRDCKINKVWLIQLKISISNDTMKPRWIDKGYSIEELAELFEDGVEYGRGKNAKELERIMEEYSNKEGE